MVKVGKLWGDAKFASLSPYSKLLYCYLISQPSITTLGVLLLDIRRISFDLKLTEDIISEEILNLSTSGYIKALRDSDLVTLFIVNHYRSLAKSKSNIRKATDEGKAAEGQLRTIFRESFIPEDFNITGFNPPTPKEVMEYALSLGYEVNGKAFVDYYGDNDWYDKNNRKVRAWRTKVAKVWCREENKVQMADGAPKGFEHFFVEIEDGVRVYPESWKGGLPSHSNYIYADYLIKGFNEQKNS